MRRISILLTLSLLAACSPSTSETGKPTGLLSGLIPSSSDSATPDSGQSSDPGSDQSSTHFDAHQSYTSLIVDARGLGIQASMSPTISTAAGQEVYPNGIPVDPDFAVNEGIAAYVYGSLAEAKASSRAGDQPLVVKAQAADGRASVLISARDASQIQQADGNTLFLSHYKVIFLLDS